jgi:hypothetical protein
MSVEATMAKNGAAQMVAALKRPTTDIHTMQRFVVHIDEQLKEINEILYRPDAALSPSYGENLGAIVILETTRVAVINTIERRKRQAEEGSL